MKRFSSVLIAAASLLSVAPALAATRPHYGGTLRIALEESPENFDPAALDTPALRSLSRLIFENLVQMDDRGQPQPALAASWRVEPGNQRWRFQVRSGVILTDGTPVDASTIAASLRAGNPHWKIFALGDLVMIETDTPDPNVPAELGLARNSIVRRANGRSLGSGPFLVEQWDAAAKHLRLAANNQYWAGRPFLDSIEVDFGKSHRDQMMLLDLGKTDLVEVAPEQIRPAQSGNRNLLISMPEELMCLVFARDPQSDGEVRLRTALARSIDTTALNNVIFQAGGEPAGGLLPNWLSGYEFVFPSGSEAGAPERSLEPPITLTLNYDSADPVARIVADRLSLNAKDAGVHLEPLTSDQAELRLLRLPLASLDGQLDLEELARSLELPLPAFGDPSITALYTAESTLLQAHRIIPLLHLRSAVALRPAVHQFQIGADGAWKLENAWLSPETP
jgi:peptide/nickel transport system substrate-binding protein